MSKNFLTREGYDKLINELQELKQEKLPAVLERLAEAKAMGDLSENFEYKSAMEDKDFINSRIAEITNLIADVEIVEKEKDIKKSDKVVDFGSKVTVRIEDDDKEYQVSIVGTGEIGIEDGLKISFESPLGQAIRGKKVGDTVKMRHEGGRKDVKIIAVD
ncbi:MAG: transcription elongation factor GreA [candidate division SR1 bacterium]|nr:transcription elongation factor GreA [candidate division SR1 bacterium]RKW25603.1 MAG: transcription elongation factor GreA [Candidatus Gracilibacteria bacterium]